MPNDFTLPELGENIAGGDVVRVLVAPGDSVKKDQPVLELETDKATIEVPSSVSGVVKEVRIKQGERIKVGQVVLTLDNGAAPAKEAKVAPQPHRRAGGRRIESAGAGFFCEGNSGASARRVIGGKTQARRSCRHSRWGPQYTCASTGRSRTSRGSCASGALGPAARTRARRRCPSRRRQRAGRAH